MNSSQILDLFSVIVIGFFTIKGSSRGLISQITWIAALLLCFKFSSVLTPLVEPVIAVEMPLRRWIAMAVVYVGLCLCIFVAASMLRGWLEKAKLKDFDKHLGSILGMSIGVVVCMTAMFFLMTIWPASQAMVRTSWSGKTAGAIIHHVDPLLRLTPDGAKEHLRSAFESYHEKLHPDDELLGAAASDEAVFGNDGATGQGGSGLTDWLLPGGGAAAETPSGNPSLNDLLGQLAPAVRDRLTRSVLEAWDSATADERQRLLEDLGRTVPNQTDSLLDEFVRVTGNGDTAGGGGVALSRQDLALLEEIDEIYGRDRKVAARALENLRGVPPTVQHAVIADWYADVMILQNDPDPGTNVTTRFDDRILRQLQQQRVSLQGLDRTLRERLTQRVP
jgi:uncharacterized membrane protein required for colicin V production